MRCVHKILRNLSISMKNKNYKSIKKSKDHLIEMWQPYFEYNTYTNTRKDYNTKANNHHVMRTPCHVRAKKHGWI